MSLNMMLVKNRPPDIDKEEFAKLWENSGYTLEALYKTLVEMHKMNDKVKPDDFKIPNHYALLAYEAGKKAAYSEIMEMLPSKSKEK